MEQQALLNTATPPSPLHNAKPKQAWHKPTVTFVPLNTTAGGKGSPTDGNTGSVPS